MEGNGQHVADRFLFLLCRAEEGCADSCIDEIGNQRTEAYVGKEVVGHVDAVVAV